MSTEQSSGGSSWSTPESGTSTGTIIALGLGVIFWELLWVGPFVTSLNQQHKLVDLVGTGALMALPVLLLGWWLVTRYV
ncbi:MAG: hypothetical protein ABEI98_01375 [Halorhabdus sp.]